ncbi:MAG TPA: PIN domain-containing protein [Firmicutes bacterium]|nr:PIN domain-containing protein [Bacillota bacterium]
MHRLFLDANVLFSAAYGSSSLSRLWDLARKKKAVLLTSAYALEEARRNLEEADQHRRLSELAREVVLVPEVLPTMPCPIPLPDKDRPVLLAALQANATHFLTGDRRHFGAYFSQSVGGTLVCTPREYFVLAAQAPASPVHTPSTSEERCAHSGSSDRKSDTDLPVEGAQPSA